ncbi:D-glycero-beta-D-manno-heptose-7-phosphate kinase [bacterium]|nr:D-glycero-beta-D-manno-heptose-7-phosphate kinase [bacterium]
MLNRETVTSGLEKFKSLRIVVVGDIMLDRYIWGNVNRISPEAPVPVVEMTDEVDRPGGAGNVVLNLTSLGAKVVPICIVGKDRCSAALKDLLQRGNAEINGLVEIKGRPTTIKTRVIADDQHVVRVDREITDPIPAKWIEKLMERISASIPDADAVILQDYNKGVMTKEIIRHSIDLARSHDIPTLVDPKFNNFFEYWGATIFKPNLREAENALARPLRTDKAIDRAGNELLARLQSNEVLLTLGAKGMALFRNAQSPVHIPSRAVKIHDVSGAGDTVISTLTLGIAAGMDSADAAQLASYAAEYVVGQIGVVPVTPEALLETASR